MNRRISACTIAISFSQSVSEKKKFELEEQAAVAVAAFGSSQVYRLRLDSGACVLTNCAPEFFGKSGSTWVFLHSEGVVSRDGKLLKASDLASRFVDSGQEVIDGLEPPFLAFVARDGGVLASSDACGLGHLFIYQGEECTAVSSSANAIAKIFRCAPDKMGITQQLMVGHRLENRSPYEGVQLIPVGKGAFLQNGQFTLSDEESHLDLAGQPDIEQGHAAIKSAVGRCLSAMPDAAIELSGGLDSRMVLAAIPREQRVGRVAYTIGYQGSGDVEISAHLAKLTGLKHHVVDLAQFDIEDTEAVWNRARRVAYRDDFATNIYDRLTLDRVDDLLLTKSRIGGANGEYARGFYYPTMPITTKANEQSAARLISWRLSTNDAAPRNIFDQSVLADHEKTIHREVLQAFQMAPAPLGRTLDQFYLRQRMRHWAGGGLTRAMSGRTILVPFFHHEYIEWANRVPVVLKRDSLAFSRVLASFDQQLAATPLDTGLVPSTLAKGGSSTQLALLRVKAKKLQEKFRQRLTGERRLNLGGEAAQSKLAQADVVERIGWASIAALGVFDPDTLEAVRATPSMWKRTTLGYMLSLHFQQEYLATNRPDDLSIVELN